ncbi:MAG: hypothetical protein QM740_00690 [Acidovorax sp.]
MKAYVIANCTAALTLLQGCTSLNAVKVTDGVMKVEGAPYFLTFTQYDFTIKRRLTSCADVDEKVVPPTRIPNMRVTTTVKAKRREARDPTREYVIDFAALRSFFKTTDVAVDYYENGALKSVNATVADSTAEFLASTFKAAAKVAALGTGVGGGSPEACTDEILKAVVAAKDGEDRLTAKTALLAQQTQRLEALQSVAVALGPTRNAAERREFADQVRALYDLKAEVDKEQKELARLLKKLTITDTVTWPKDGSTFSGELAKPLTLEALERWGVLDDLIKDRLVKETGVYALIGTDSPPAKHVVCVGDSCEKTTPVEDLPGLKYRMPMAGNLKACSNATCAGNDAELYKDAGLFSQLGPVMTLPLKNYPFMTQSIVLTMNEVGQPTKIGYKSEANAAKAMDMVNSFVDEYGKVRQADKPKSELDRVNEETALLEAKAKLATAKTALDAKPNEEQTTATDALKADTALLEAELAKMKAQAALDAAKKQATP